MKLVTDDNGYVRSHAGRRGRTVIFCYWDSTDYYPVREAVQVWRSHFPEFQVIGDREVEPLLAQYFPLYLESYKKIRIPTCKSHFARLLALYQYGGLYVDCHCGINDVNGIRQLMEALDTFEMVVFDKDQLAVGWHITNSFIFCENGLRYTP